MVMNIVQYIKAYKELVVIFVAIVTVIFSVTFSQCSKQWIETVIDNTEDVRLQVIDSVKRVEEQKRIQIADSLRKAYEQRELAANKEINSYKKENTSLKKKLSTLEQEYKDSSTIEKCEEIVEVQKEVIINQDSIIVKKDVVIGTYDDRIKLLNVQLVIKDEQAIRQAELYSRCQDNTDRLVRELKRKNTWWKRNEKWIYFGAGAAGTFFLARELK